MSNIIYININISATEKKIRDFADKYNLSVNFDKKYTVKGSHLNTACRIIKFFYKYCQNVERSKTNDLKFIINNQALATTNGYYKSTAWRHIQRLKEAGIISKTIFRGTNTGYEVILNNEILAANWNKKYAEEVLNECKKITELNEFDRKRILCVCPRFEGDLPRCFIAVCNDIATRTLQELNININKVVFSKNEKTFNNTRTIQEPFKQEHRNKNLFFSGEKFSTQKNIENNNNNNDYKSFEQIMVFYVNMLFSIAMNLLYKDKKFSEFTVSIAKKHLLNYFLSLCENETKIVETYNKLSIRLMIVRKYLLKAPGRFVPSPDVYFDPMFDKGFIGTETWYQSFKKQMEINKEYYQNQRIFVYWWRKWNLRPSLDIYRQATQQLGKKKDKYFYELFLKCVIDKNNIKEINKFN